MRLLLDLHPDDYPLEGFRRKQLLEWVFVQGVGAFDTMTNLPAGLRAQLEAEYRLNPFQDIETVRSHDGSVKYLFTLLDGRQMEAVYMPYLDRKTICVSTMVGCPARCAFCATGKMGFGRNLTPGEIVGQVLAVAGGEGISPREIRNLVFMGMGEALLNYEHSMAAARVLLHPDALGMSKRRVTLSTVGIAKGIRRLAEEDDLGIKLAISLHAPDEETRQKIIPTGAANSIDEIMAAARDYQSVTGRRVTMEYTMLRGVNDHLWQAELLADRLSGLVSHVNLIPMNPWEGSDFESSSEEQIQAFYDALQDRGVDVSVRRSRGKDAGAACGQLALRRPGARTGAVGAA
ncbi:23S rRNA (adenine(2503)-C(2))-methyltransferase RlmN [Deinococcus wulumuqiensis]|uniref:Probable dual-specificity RNA methyltransferase RlmN n=1 Tax=Deinococcus wulumuqiensis TaxID=980427 RepID=A0AAV4K3W1_9DEIO|nr:23S rRNA (adenine(2503)-C(2))-methyltransferase RlmN [Deinococcus wulumuqiensis]QII20606.1 23S rRNA (adenine(2503)-C(2))-methyltransferase RlmN [Deinococcus wulumuqiensis R12]GGI72753.1 putative dual-specificity RNA methyltransferase RlmN [Deinococcus wulumuqiensis]GGP28560.1 putative dual-specificity RNA methyltransferase RlmN [Deinococcus wulumuqiensis]